MKVILLKSYDTLGKTGDIVSVKSGYARNYLLPNKIATIANDATIKNLQAWIEQQSIKEAKNKENLESLAKYLGKLTIKFSLQAGEDGKLFGSVTSQMISEEIEKQGYTVDKKEIILEEPIKNIGNHYVYVDLDCESKPKIKVKVSAANK